MTQNILFSTLEDPSFVRQVADKFGDGMLSTSWLSGGNITVNANPALVDISAGTGIYVDNFTDPRNPQVIPVSFGPFVGVPIDNIATQPFTRLLIDKDGNLVQRTTIFRDEMRELFALGEVQHGDLTTIDAVSQFTNIPSVGVGASLYDLASIIGDINIDGNVFSPNGANMKVDKTEGNVFTLWFAAKDDIKDPSKIPHPALSALNFIYTFRDGAGGYTVVPANSDILAGAYDDGTVTGANTVPNGVVPNNKYTVQHVYLGQANTVIIHHGQNTYPTIVEAEAQLGKEPFEINPDLKDVLFRGWIIVKGNATDLSDPTQAHFVESGRFGAVGTASSTIGLSGWKDNIRDFSSARGNGTTEPQWQDIGNGQYAYRFTAGDELFVKFHVTHDYKLGTNAYPHVHFLVTQPMTAGQQVTWSFNYTIARGHAQGESLSGAETTINLVYTATGTEVAGEHLIIESSDIDAFDLLEPDTIVAARIKLESENVTGNIFGIMADLHYQTDRLSTINKAPDFYS